VKTFSHLGMQRPENPPRSVGASSLAVLFLPCRVDHESTLPWLMGMMWCDNVVFLALVSPIYSGDRTAMHEGRSVLIPFDPVRRRIVDLDLSCSVLCPWLWTGTITSGLVLSKLDSPGGDVTGHSSEALMIQMRLCWGEASRAEEAGRTASL
jgi:hypothetical protein